MEIIAAYPCLGKTTLYKLNKDIIFDREFNESRSTIGMTQSQVDSFFESCANIVQVQAEANHVKYLFITEDDRLLFKLYDRGINPIIIFPNVFDAKYMEEYKANVIRRSGQDWYDRVIKPDDMEDRIRKHMSLHKDVRFTTTNCPFIEDVFTFSEDVILP